MKSFYRFFPLPIQIEVVIYISVAIDLYSKQQNFYVSLIPTMNENQKHTIDRMNKLGAEGRPFVFIIDFDFEKPLIFDFSDGAELLWKTPEANNYLPEIYPPVEIKWTIHPIEFQEYEKAFYVVQDHIHNGDTYLLNLTMPDKVETNLSLEEMFHLSNAPIKFGSRNNLYVSHLKSLSVFRMELFLRSR